MPGNSINAQAPHKEIYKPEGRDPHIGPPDKREPTEKTRAILPRTRRSSRLDIAAGAGAAGGPQGCCRGLARCVDTVRGEVEAPRRGPCCCIFT